jgi:hypothetical protein
MSCVNQIYDSSNAYFQASVTIPSGGDILGGYDASLNKLIFAYENTCEPLKVMDLTSGWISPYAVSRIKIGLDNNCQDVSGQVLLYDTPPAYEILSIKQMNILRLGNNDQIIVCCGHCNLVGTSNSGYGFLFSFKLSTGEPFTAFDSVPSGTSVDGWFIRANGSTPSTNMTKINTVYGIGGILLYGGSDDNGSVNTPVLQQYTLSNTGSVINSDAPPTNNYGYQGDDSVVDILPSPDANPAIIPIIYQSNSASSTVGKIHIRSLSVTPGTGEDPATFVWKTTDYELPSANFGPSPYWSYNYMQYSSSCVAPDGYAFGPVIYISATGRSNETPPQQTPMIYAVIYNNSTSFELASAFAPEQDFANSPGGVHVYRNQPGNSSSDWTGLQIDNISYISKSSMNSYLSSVNTNVLFVTLSSIASPQTRYLSFIAALTDNQPTSPTSVNHPIVPIINAIALEESPVWTLKKQGGFYNYLTVEFDSQLTGTLNDLQFKLNFCSSALYLFAFGNYVNSPAQASVSSGLLLNAISNICLSKGTQILCDQGIINIEKINTRKHTINNKQINHITQSIHTDDYLIKIKKNCLSSNSPSSDIICSGDHKILYKNNLIEAKNLINEVYGIEKIKNDKRVLYNILMDKHEVIMANNTPVESLHPQNIIAMFYNNYNNPQAREFLSDKIGQMNKNNHYITEANKTNSIHLRNGTSKKTSIPLRIGNKK